MRCRDWEEIIAVGVTTCRLLQECEDDWREHVFRGSLPFDPEDDLDHRERFILWLEVTQRILQQIVPDLEREFGIVEGAEQLHGCASAVERALQTWQSPSLSAAVGLREMTLSSEGATELDRLIEEAKHRPPDVIPGPPMQSMSPEEFLRRRRSKRQ